MRSSEEILIGLIALLVFGRVLIAIGRMVVMVAAFLIIVYVALAAQGIQLEVR